MARRRKRTQAEQTDEVTSQPEPEATTEESNETEAPETESLSVSADTNRVTYIVGGKRVDPDGRPVD